jgi:hypothetical protein
VAAGGAGVGGEHRRYIGYVTGRGKHGHICGGSRGTDEPAGRGLPEVRPAWGSERPSSGPGARCQVPDDRVGDCERFKAAKAHDPCGCHFPELPGLFGVKMG